VAAVAGSGSLWHHGSSSRQATNRYIGSVDAVEQQMRLPLTRVMTAYRSFSTNATSPAGRSRLAQATLTLGTLERRVASLDAPPSAAKLQRLLLELVGQERLVAHEVQRLAAFLPRFERLTLQARAAQTTLAHELAAITVPAPHAVRGNAAAIARARAEFASTEKRTALRRAAAIEKYDRSIAGVGARLKTLRPPPVVAPAYRSQLRTIVSTHAAGVALVRALRGTRLSDVQTLSRRLAVASRLAWTLGAQRAEIGAIKAYNRRVRAVGSLQGRLQLEVSRLAGATH
jgi:hypothetical protein